MSSYIKLAKFAVETFIEKKEIISIPDDLPKEMTEKKAGVFVTIKKQGKLRGCIGTYVPTKENIAQEIIRNAIAAALEDDRFEPVKKEELSFLSYQVYILSDLELIKNISELDPKKYGIFVKTIDGLKSGLLLPDLENINTVEKQALIACQKADIDPQKERIVIYRFTAEKYQ